MATNPVNIYGDLPNDVLNIARTRCNELIRTPQGYPGATDPGAQFNRVGGGYQSPGQNPDGTLILETQFLFNSGYRRLWKFLGNLGYRLLIVDNWVISELPINSNPDPTVQSWLSWNGFWNGTTFTSTPALPLDFYAPLKIRERVSGQNATFIPMGVALDGINSGLVRTILNRRWEWRTNALYMPGATSLTDLQLRYVRRLPDLPDPNYYVPNTPWYQQKLDIPNCWSSLAWYIAHEALSLQPGDEAAEGAALALSNAELDANAIFNDQARADQRTNNRRRPRGGGSSNQRGYRYGL